MPFRVVDERILLLDTPITGNCIAISCFGKRCVAIPILGNVLPALAD
jgi:hypothetical protein